MSPSSPDVAPGGSPQRPPGEAVPFRATAMERRPVAPWVPDRTTYRRRRRLAVVVSGLLAVPFLWCVAAMVVTLYRGGDTRLGMVPYVMSLYALVVGLLVAVPLWRRARDARHALLPRIDDLPSAVCHRGLDASVELPRRW
ncbi:hypothetical protein H9657_13760 [Cellulomonas sp. Sa3CUA2]|uniref:Integral membrane protein n=1 Tax=Cellulomonas avistercoris TaxID=2762242 RepID=A0ABR8QG49_9CELL|nr:hypothetical protein [Cellulomonas avistercoris]MBD7919336.1 hypothetical protein [Cellulomonas avistercoris]